jgi:hypothetical protein
VKGGPHPKRWALRWIGNETHIMWHDCKPLLFQTRREARDYAVSEYGYIREREDLREPPHNWRMPRPVRVDVVIREHKATP